MDGFAGEKPEPPAQHAHSLILLGHKVHLDAAFPRIVNCLVAEGFEVERTFEFAVYSRQEIEVKGGGYTRCVIVGADQLTGVLLEVNANDKPSIW